MEPQLHSSYAGAQIRALIEKLQTDKAQVIAEFDAKVATLTASLEILDSEGDVPTATFAEDLPIGWDASLVTRLQGQRNLEQRLIVMAQASDETIKARPAAVFLRATGISRAKDVEGLYTNITSELGKSDRFTKSDTGVYKLNNE